MRSTATLGLAVATGLLFSGNATASFADPYSLSQFTLENSTCSGAFPDGHADTFDGGLTVLFTGSNSGSGCPITTTLTIAAAASGTVSFDWSFANEDFDPGFDIGGYIVGATFTPFAFLDGDSGSISFAVAQGQTFGFYIDSDDQAGTGTLTLSNFNAPLDTAVPEPGTLGLAAAGLGLLVAWRKRAVRAKLNGILSLALLATTPTFAQAQNYVGSTVTGLMNRTAVVNLTNLAGVGQFSLSLKGATAFKSSVAPVGPEFAPKAVREADRLQSRGLGRLLRTFSSTTAFGATAASLPVTTATGLVGFNGLTHKDQREANNGNQFSIEPPNESIAVANGYILEGVNNAVRVYSINGTPLLPTLATNQVFAVPPAIDRTTGVEGVYGTDMRVFFDHTISRWFILQRSQDNTPDGIPLSSSKIYVAVSQTADPTQNYNVYTINTTAGGSVACPCIADYPQIGSDQHGFYIAANEYVAPTGTTFAGATVLAISKASLAANAVTPTMVKFFMTNATGYEFSLQPATTAPGSSSFLAGGGLEYLISTISLSSGSNVGLWAITNTASLNNPNPSLQMTRILVPTLPYSIPNVAALQKNGPIPLGSDTSEYPPFGFSAARPIDGGDSRVQSVVYSGGRLYVTWATSVTDENLVSLSGAAYAIITPAYRTGALSARVNAQGNLQVTNNSLLRPAWAVNSQGNGSIVFTLVGPDHFPSVAFIRSTAAGVGSSVEIVAPGTAPQDGFTGYDEGIARWGDYSTAVASSDGAIWMVGQYIPSLPRTTYANWGTYIFRYVP